MRWIEWLALLVATGFLLTQYVIPLLVRRLSSNARVRSFGLRSARGVFIKFRSITYTAERIALVIHRPPGGLMLKVGLEVQDVVITVAKRPPKTSDHARKESHWKGLRDRHSKALSVASITGILRGSKDAPQSPFQDGTFPSVIAFFRTLFRSFAALTLRILVRLLPALTQSFDIRCDRVTLVFDELNQAHVVIRGARLSTLAQFTQQDQHSEDVITDPVKREDKDTEKMLKVKLGWGKKWKDSLDRAWDMATAKTDGFASVAVELEDLSAFPGSELNRPTAFRTRSTSRRLDLNFTSDTTKVENSMPLNAFLFIQGPAQIKAAVGFSPQRSVFKRHTGEFLLRLPSVEVALDPLQAILKHLHDAPKNDPIHELESSPGASTWSPMTRSFPPPGSPKMLPQGAALKWTPALRLRRKPKKTLQQVFLSVLKGVEINIPSFIVKHEGLKDVGGTSGAYSATMKGFLSRLQLSNPNTNILHQKWLGSTTPAKQSQDQSVYSLTLQSQLLAVHRAGDELCPSLRLMRVGDVSVEAVSVNWPATWLVSPKSYVGDANAAFVAVEVDVEGVEVCERVEIVRLLMENLPRTHHQDTAPAGPMLHPVPRLQLNAKVGPISLRLLHPSPSGLDLACVNVATQGLGIGITTAFLNTFSRDALPYGLAGNHIPLTMECVMRAYIEPLTLHADSEFPAPPADFAGDISWCISPFPPSSPSVSFTALPSPTSMPDPVLKLARLEVTGNGSVFGHQTDDGLSVTSINMATVLAEVGIVIEDILVDISRPDPVAILAAIIQHVHIEDFTESDDLPSKPLFDRLPPGLLMYIAFPSIRLAIAGIGINPEDYDPLPRGLALATSFQLRYCYLNTTHIPRFKDRFFEASSRARLSLEDNIVQEASSYAIESSSTEGRSALLQFNLARTSICCIVEHDEGVWYDLSGSFSEPGNDMNDRLLLRVPSVGGSMLFRRQPSNDAEGRKISDTARLTIKIPQLTYCFTLHHIYCALTAVNTLSTLRPAAPYRSPGRIRPRQPSLFSINAHIDDAEIIAILPFGSNLFIRLQALGYTLSTSNNHKVHLHGMCAWVPNVEKAGEWDEIGRMTNWVIAIEPSQEKNVGAKGKSLRLRIPHRFVLADLIQDINISVKAAKHLMAMVRAGRYFPIPEPPVEEAKVVPHLKLEVDAVAIEVLDSPLESKLNLIWRAGFDEQRSRRDRESAFDAKVEAIKAAALGERPSEVMTSSGKQKGVSATHTVSIEEARQRLDLYNSSNWIRRHKIAQENRSAREELIASRIRDPAGPKRLYHSLPIDVKTPEKTPPLLRLVLQRIKLEISPPLSSGPSTSDFLHDVGNGLPHDTSFTLLIPLHLNWTMDGAKATLRDYPLPLLSVGNGDKAWECSTMLVIAEEAGTAASTDWVECLVQPPPTMTGVGKALRLVIPKTVMPVKSYADPVVHIRSQDITDISWGVSYTPALQDVMRVLDTLSTAPRDRSPAIGFWDKLRLAMHWRLSIDFDGEVHFHVKGSRDPYYVTGVGAGFVLSFDGPTKITLGHSPQDKELIQVSSRTTVLAIPDLKHFQDQTVSNGLSAMGSPSGTQNQGQAQSCSRNRSFTKVCAKLTNGVRWGLGFLFERTCGAECAKCGDRPLFARKCRHFDFLPHYNVELRASQSTKDAKRDSFAGFRSHFIHFSMSITSPTSPDDSWKDANGKPMGYNIFHLSPKAFAHFFSWWSLFNGTLALPIQQGKLFPDTRPPSPKFGRHIATIKYRFSFAPLFISHVYKQDLREQWTQGQTGCVGVKAMVEDFRADLHQREQAITVVDPVSGILKTTTHKPFYAAEVVITNLEMRAMSAVFSDPRKAQVSAFQAQQMPGHYHQPLYFSEALCQDLSSKWVDFDDFVETDWTPNDENPRIWMFRAATCPRFTFFRTLGTQQAEVSKFGGEDTHICLLASGESTQEIQIDIARRRMSELQEEIGVLSAKIVDEQSTKSHDSSNASLKNSITSDHRIDALQRSISRLQSYVEQLEASQNQRPDTTRRDPSFDGFTYGIYPDDWAEFQHVYQVHSPQIIFSNSTRNILLNYYYSSVSRRGFEYHMSARAVKFIREQAQTEIRRSMDSTVSQSDGKLFNPATKAATALRRILVNEPSPETRQDSEGPRLSSDLLEGTQTQISKKPSHFCLLLKPQVVLHCEEKEGSIVCFTAMEASLQIYTILDMEHSDDPISSYIMARNYVKLRGLQAFAPLVDASNHRQVSVPLEILIDFRCESNEYFRLVPQTDATIQYDKFNRLRLHNRLGNASGELAALDAKDDHLLYQTDRIIVDIPRFNVTANSDSFSALRNIVANLILYTDPTHSYRNEALETFLFTYDFTDFSSAAEVVVTLQTKIRQLLQIARRYDLTFDALDECAQMDALSVHAHLTALADELDFIFAAIRLAQEKAQNLDNNLASALKLEAKSDLISWQMLGLDHGLIAKLAVKGVGFSWVSRKDSTTSNVLTIKDLQALNGNPNTTLSEILLPYPHPSNHPMVKRKLFAEVVWTALPPVGQISVIENLDVRLHPVKVQIERRVGRDIQEYVSPKHLRLKNAAPLSSSVASSTLLDRNSPQAEPRVRTLSLHRGNTSPVVTSAGRRSFEDSPTLNLPKMALQRASSFGNLKEAAEASAPKAASTTTRSLARSTSSANLKEAESTAQSSRDVSLPHRQATMETQEMRARAQKRTFLAIDLHSFLLVLTYKGEPMKGTLPRAKDLVPNVSDFHLAFPKYEHRNCTWSVEEFLADVKAELMRNAFGVVLKAVAAKTNKRFHIEPSSPPSVPRPLPHDSLPTTTADDGQRQKGHLRFQLFAPKSKPSSSNKPTKDEHRSLEENLLPQQDPHILDIQNLSDSPPVSRSGTSLSTSELSFPTVTDAGRRPQLEVQTRSTKVFKLFHRSHRNRGSGDSSSSSIVSPFNRLSHESSRSGNSGPPSRQRTYSDIGH